MSRTRRSARLRAVPTSAAPRDCLVSSDAMNDADLKLSQIRAIADLIGTADAEMLYDDTIALATHTICDLVTETTALIGNRKPANAADQVQP